MNKEKQNIVPELRFPKFSEKWRYDELQNLSRNIMVGIASAATHAYRDSGVILFRNQNIKVDGLDVSDILYIDEIYEKQHKNKRLKGGDLLTARTGYPGTTCVVPTEYEGAQSFTTLITRPKNELINSTYLCYYINSEKGQAFFEATKIGGGQKNVNAGSLSEMPILFPSLSEQQKIANCLSSLDNLITAETEKLNHLKDHKKGLLQQLFPAKGEKKPQFRFPEFENDGDWEEKCVNDFFEVISSKRVLQKDWVKEGVPFYRTRELVSLSKNEPFGSEIYISEELFLELSEKYGVPKSGDFLVSGVGTLGILYQVKENDKFYFKDGNVIWFKLNRGIVSDYFKHCFYTKFFQKQIFRQSSASTVGTYTISNARQTKLWKPIRYDEQQKIANCLSSADDLIQEQISKINTLNEYKKGLMQQMFPNIKTD